MILLVLPIVLVVVIALLSTCVLVELAPNRLTALEKRVLFVFLELLMIVTKPRELAFDEQIRG